MCSPDLGPVLRRELVPAHECDCVFGYVVFRLDPIQIVLLDRGQIALIRHHLDQFELEVIDAVFGDRRLQVRVGVFAVPGVAPMPGPPKFYIVAASHIPLVIYGISNQVYSTSHI
jgi:hypothetical protein